MNSFREKILFIILIFLGITGVSIGVYNIFRPFTNGNFFKELVFKAKSDIKNMQGVKNQLEIFQELEKKDTDQDGLTDLEEILTYNTSPYLKDTDSDGLSDKEEIEQGKDPLCPEGKECGILSNKVSEKKELNKNEENKIEDLTNLLKDKSLENLSAKELRELLKDQGVSEEFLNKVDDKTLEETWKEIIKNNPESNSK